LYYVGTVYYTQGLKAAWNSCAEQAGRCHTDTGPSTQTENAWRRLGVAKIEPLHCGCWLGILFLFLGKRLLVHQMLQGSRHNWVGHQRDSIRACSRDYGINLCGILMRKVQGLRREKREIQERKMTRKRETRKKEIQERKKPGRKGIYTDGIPACCPLGASFL